MGINKEILINGLVTIIMVWIALATYDKFVAPFIGGAIGKGAEKTKAPAPAPAPAPAKA